MGISLRDLLKNFLQLLYMKINFIQSFQETRKKITKKTAMSKIVVKLNLKLLLSNRLVKIIFIAIADNRALVLIHFFFSMPREYCVLLEKHLNLMLLFISHETIVENT